MKKITLRRDTITLPDKPMRGEDGASEPEEVRASIRPADIHYPRTGLICLESTHYRYGGIVPPLEKIGRIHLIANSHQIPVHLDGARLFNASLFLELMLRKLQSMRIPLWYRSPRDSAHRWDQFYVVQRTSL